MFEFPAYAQVVFTIVGVCGPSAWQESHDLTINSRISIGKNS